MSAMIKDCQPYEKTWRGFCVDKNLEDRWLGALNDLETLNLIGICEGHYPPRKNRASKFPHINLRLKENLLPGLIMEWETLRPAMLNEFHQLFQEGDTFFNLELRFKLRTGRSRLVYQEELSLKMRRYQPRQTEEMDSETADWFERSVTSIQAIDRIILGWYQTPEK